MTRRRDYEEYFRRLLECIKPRGIGYLQAVEQATGLSPIKIRRRPSLPAEWGDYLRIRLILVDIRTLQRQMPH